ncbi:hypothetical protein SODALDRAFT_362054 [Sodiomyces alkalinus F11]|uniref:Secreted protein n=1 Tax=Sodiomyces alkalinus (strain CBS 110278 / VKM F-3762 / F11) TaxID=1314773 RepID=A0A3N2PP19_SODAK|nr:hypothetical protein SODALDRAFT_362054 [Sodiomyces alkalinus F11]ROT36267.1 hypothetical protein SODALDRAFT_362054 [Sodiomyces alkalinus F11]
MSKILSFGLCMRPVQLAILIGWTTSPKPGTACIKEAASLGAGASSDDQHQWDAFCKQSLSLRSIGEPDWVDKCRCAMLWLVFCPRGHGEHHVSQRCKTP